MPRPELYPRLSGFYLVYFASLGAFWPYFGLYLDELAFSAGAIGLLMAMAQATRIVSPPFWGWVADRDGRHMHLVRLASLVATLVFGATLLVHSFAGLAVVLVVHAFFWTAALPQFEASTLAHLGKDHHRYSLIRAWGSFGFIIAVVAVGAWIDARGAQGLPWLVTGLFLGIWLMSLRVPEAPLDHRGHVQPPLGTILLRPPVLALFAAIVLQLVAFGPYQVFFALYLDRLDYSAGVTGWLIALGVAAEIAAFLFIPRLLERFGPRLLMLLAVGLSAVRWGITAVWAVNIEVLLPTQLLHLFTFGVFHAASVYLIHHHFPGRLRGRGQALYASLGFGLGGALGSLLGGQVWDLVGPEATFLAAAGVATLATVVVLLGVRDPTQQRSGQARTNMNSERTDD